MPSLRRIANAFDLAHKGSGNERVNWNPGHMYSGMQAMIGKLNAVDCIIEVHDARIPLVGRNKEFRQHLGTIKPRILVLNKSDLADLSQWDRVKEKLADQGDRNVFLTDMTGSQFSHEGRGYTKLLDRAVTAIRESNRYNRELLTSFKIMIVGIPNVGKSTLINRLRQHHLGRKGEATKTGNMAGVTRHVEQTIKISSRPLIYSIDTPGVLQPSAMKNHQDAMRLALCSTINDRVLKPYDLARFLLQYFNNQQNFFYIESMGLEVPSDTIENFCNEFAARNYPDYQSKTDPHKIDSDKICWKFVLDFRKGLLGKVMFD